ENQPAHFIGIRQAPVFFNGIGLDDVQKWPVCIQRRPPDHSEVQEIFLAVLLPSVFLLQKMIMVVAEEIGPDRFDKLFEMLAIAQHGLVISDDASRIGGLADLGALGGVGADAELFFVRIGGVKIDVSQMRRIPFAQMGHKFTEAGKSASTWFIGEKVSF